MTEMGATPKTVPSYVDRLDHDGSPESMPEVARELTILRGAISSVDRGLSEAFEEFNLLSDKLRPLTDETPGPVNPYETAAALATSTPHVATGVGNDLRKAYEHIGSLEAQVGTLASRIRHLRSAVLL